VKPLLVEEWLSGLDRAPKSKGHLRSIMHILFNWAMKWVVELVLPKRKVE
jgi:hypothetical protein